MSARAPSSLRRSVVLVAAVLGLAACAQGPTITTGTDALPGATTVTATPPPAIPGGGSCTDLSPTTKAKRGFEVQGKMRGGDPFYALFDGVRSLPAGRPLTTYLRLPGARSVRLTLIGPQDRIVRVPPPHPGLPPYPWARPGDAWAGTVTFPQTGCWRIAVARSTLDGEMWVRVG
jgi:hypothetical protein